MTTKKITILLLAICALAFPAQASETLYLNNGDRLSGDVRSYDANAVNIKTSYGDFKIPVNEIAGVESLNKQLKATIEGAVETATALSIGETPLTMPASIAAIEPAAGAKEEPKPKLFDADTSGNINVGLGLTTGNSDKNNVNVDGKTELRWDKHRTIVKAEYNREEEDDAVSTDDRLVSLTHDYFFVDQWFLQGAGKLEKDEIANLDQRTTLSGGLGYQPFERDDLELKFVAGPGWRKEEFKDGSDESYMTGEWQMDYMQKFYEDAFRLFHNHDLSIPVDETDSFVFQSESGIRVPIRAGIIASGQVDFDWQNNPPAGAKEDDTTYTIKLGYEW